MSTDHMYAYVVYDRAGKGSSTKKGSKDTPVPRTFFDIIELRLVPKAHRHEGHKTRVRWEDKQTKKVTSHYVTIKKISGEYSLLIFLPLNIDMSLISSVMIRSTIAATCFRENANIPFFDFDKKNNAFVTFLFICLFLR